MDSIAGYIATLCVGATGQYLSQFLKPKVKINFWLSHQFTYTIPTSQLSFASALFGTPPPANFFLLTQSVTIKNNGRESTPWVEIAHSRRPDFFQLHPAFTFTESTSEDGQHVIRVESLAAKESFTIQFLCYSHSPTLAFIRSSAGPASLMPWIAVKKFPQWVYALMWIVMLMGAGTLAYWLVKIGKIVLAKAGAL